MRIRGILSVLGAVVAAALAAPAFASANAIDYPSNINSPSITATTTEASPDVGPEDSITVEPNVTVRATSGNVQFQSADNVITGSASVVQSATGNVTISSGSGDTDSDSGISIAGSVIASGNVTVIAWSGNLCFHSIAAVGTVTLIAPNGSIAACSGQATISANTLDVVASTGIGSGSPLMTTVSNLGATTTTGNINIDNTGALSIDQLSGIQVTGASGAINLTNSGSLSVKTSGDTISAPNSVSIQTVGVSADIATGGQASASAITGGGVYLQAGRDILLGDANGIGSVQSAAGVILYAGRDVDLNANAVISNPASGNVVVQAGRNVSMSTATGTLSGAPEISASGGGTLMVMTGPGGAFTAASTGADAVSATNSVFIEADSATIGAGISSGAARTTLTVAGANRPINLGSKPAGALGLTQAELDLVSGAVLQVGSPGAGNLTISSPIASSGASFNVMTLITGGAVIDGTAAETPILTVPDLRIDAGNGIGTADDIDTAVNVLAIGNGGGPVSITNQRATTIGTVDGDTGVENSGSTTTLISSGPLSVNQPVQSGGKVLLHASDSGAPGANLTLAPTASVNVTNGDAVLLAGDNLAVNAGAAVTAGGAVRLECDYGDANPFDSCTISDPQGGLSGSPVALRGGDDNGATFTVAGESLKGRGPLTITGAPGSSSTASVTGAAVTGSPGAGLQLDDLISATVTGDTFTGDASDGVAVDNSSGVLISGDTIWGNGGLGIDLLDSSNHGSGAPVLSFAAPTGGSTEVKGTMTGISGHTYRVAFFDNPSCDASGFGEGKTPLGTTDVTTNASGHGTFDVTLPAASAPADAVAATATDKSSNETSEFSRCIQRADLGVAVAASPSPVVAGGTLAYTVTVSNRGPNASTGSTVVDTLPGSVSFLSASSGCVDAAATVTCDEGPIAAGASTALTITVRTPAEPGSLTDTATVSGQEQDLNQGDNTASTVVTVTAPTVTKSKPTIAALTVRPKRFKAARSGPSTTNSHGAAVSYTDTLPATTKFTVERVLQGRLSGRQCVAQTKLNHHSRSCVRLIPMRGSFTHADVAGHNSLRFTGRIGNHRLAHGTYQLDATPTSGALAGPSVTAVFSIA